MKVKVWGARQLGWGHSRLGDVLAYAQLTEAQRLMLFHHDPLHDDEQLDRLHLNAVERWEALGRSPHELALAAELQELDLAAGIAPQARLQRAAGCGCGIAIDPIPGRSRTKHRSAPASGPAWQGWQGSAFARVRSRSLAC